MLKRVLEMFISNKIINFHVEIVKRINYSVHHGETKHLFCCVPEFEYKSCVVGLLKTAIARLPNQVEGKFEILLLYVFLIHWWPRTKVLALLCRSYYLHVQFGYNAG